MQRRVIVALLAALLMATAVRAQTTGPLYVAAYFEVKPASAAAAAALAGQYVRTARMDAGNTRAEAFQEIGRTNRFVVISAWRDAGAFSEHEKAAHTTDFRAKLKAIQQAPYDQRTHTGFAVDPMPADAGANAIFVVTHVDVPGNRREEAEMLLRRLWEPGRATSGHVRYDVYQQTDRTNHFTVFAAWASRAAFDAYGGTPHALQFREVLGPMLGALYDERLYQAIRP